MWSVVVLLVLSGMHCCGAAASVSAGRNAFNKTDILSDTVTLLVVHSDRPGWAKVRISSSKAGWLGFGVAKPGKPCSAVLAYPQLYTAVGAAIQHCPNHLYLCYALADERLDLRPV